MTRRDAFYKYLRYEKRFSDHTLAAYQRDLTQFHDFLLNSFELKAAKDIRHTHVRSWVVQLLGEGKTSRTVRRKLSALRTYFRFLRQQGDVQHDPLREVKTPKLPSRLPKTILPQEMSRLLDELAFAPDFSGQRDYLILQMLYATGVRRSELLGLMTSDVDQSRQEIRVIGKGNKERVIPVTIQLLQLLRQYIVLRDQAFPDTSFNHLFITDKGKPLYPKYLYNKVHHYLSLVSHAEVRSPHALRHSFATHLVEKGAELQAVKALLGHASLASTEVYTHNSIEQLKRVYHQAHPQAEEENA